MRVAEGHERWADEDLLRGIAGCDREAFSVFYRRHLPAVLRFLAREARDPEVAADLAAEVFAAVALGSGRYRAANPTADAWLIGIARNTLGASRRRGRVEARARRRLGYEPVELLDSDLERVQAIVDAGRGGVLGLAQALPEDERVAVHQRVVQEREYAEIAADLRCSEMVVRKRVSRGLARLRAQMREPS
jgi:RNA polymerase sigma factor (sigma-70 family)